MPNIKSAKKRVKIIEKKSLDIKQLLKSLKKQSLLEIKKKQKFYFLKLPKKSIKLAPKVLLLKTQLLEKNLAYQKN